MSDPFDALAELPPNNGYSKEDRYHDFRKVFGTTEGKRVFRELLGWGGMFKPSVHSIPIDPLELARRDGERNFALRLLATYHNEPLGQPKKQTIQGE